MPSTALPDTSCLIALDKIGRLGLLTRSWDAVLVPDAVCREFGTTPVGAQAYAVQDRRLVHALRLQLHEGESEIIAAVLENEDAVAVLDDRKARRLARAMGAEVLGTIGLLLRAKRKGMIDAVRPIMDELERAGFHVSQRTRTEALRIAGEA